MAQGKVILQGHSRVLTSLGIRNSRAWSDSNVVGGVYVIKQDQRRWDFRKAGYIWEPELPDGQHGNLLSLGPRKGAISMEVYSPFHYSAGRLNFMAHSGFQVSSILDKLQCKETRLKLCKVENAEAQPKPIPGPWKPTPNHKRNITTSPPFKAHSRPRHPW